MNRDPGRGPWMLPTLPGSATLDIGGGVADPAAPIVWISAGAALEVSGFIPAPSGAGWLLLEGVVGQATLASSEPDEASVLDVLARKHGQLAIEQVLCRTGVVQMYRAVCLLRGVKPRRIGLASIVDATVTARDAECARAMTMFCGLLGDLAGGVALTLGARGGVVLSGDIVPRLGDWFVRSPFRRRFDARGRYSATLRAIPTIVARGDVSPVGTSATGR